MTQTQPKYFSACVEILYESNIFFVDLVSTQAESGWREPLRLKRQ